MSNTITGFNTFAPKTTIYSGQVNENFQYLKDHSPLWHVYTLSSTDFLTAANTNTGTLFNADPKEVIHGYGVKHSTAFSGGSVTSCSLSLGDSSNRYRYIDSFDVYQATTQTAKDFFSDIYVPDFGATTAVEWTIVSGGSTLDSLSAGVVELYVLKSILP